MKNISNEDFILKIIKYVPVILIIVVSALTTIYISSSYAYNLKIEKEKIEKEYIDFNKDLIKDNIKTVSDYINNKHALTNEILRNQLKDQIHAAHNMMTSIYSEFKDTKSKEEITLIIKTALKNMQFSDRRYYFLYDLDGVMVFHPTKPEREGMNFINLKDANGTFIIQESIKIAKSDKGEGYKTWMFDKPKEHSNEFEKIGFVKKFSPYNWVIGTGEYIEDFNNLIKQEILTHIKDVRFNDTAYTFVIDKTADFLLTRTNYSKVSDMDEKNLFIKSYDDFINSNDEDRYLEYGFVDNSNNNEYFEKISYLKKIKEYDWVIGTGFNSDKLHLIIKEKQTTLEKQYNKQINLILIIASVMTILLLVLSILISKALEKRFQKYKEDLEGQISENKKQKDTLLRAQKVAHIGDWKLDIKTNKVFWSNEVIRILGMQNKNKDDFGVELLKNVVIEEDISNLVNSLNACINTGAEHKVIYRIKKPNNEIRWIDCRGELDEDKLSIIGTVQDITENKILEIERQQKDELFYQQSKMAAMGEMIGNIAHQWRQPLSIISTIATGIKIQKEFGTLKEEELVQNMDLINKNAQYLSETINDFRNFIKGDRKIKTYDLSTTINNFLHIIESTIKTDNINIILDLEKDIKLEGYPNELIQCLINIFNNSKDAFKEIKQENPLLFISTSLQNNIINISIKDNAGGISPNIISKIYDPYFTTKHKSQGTGLGLHMTYKLIDEGMNGRIEAQNVEFEYENKIFKGAEFIIILNY